MTNLYTVTLWSVIDPLQNSENPKPPTKAEYYKIYAENKEEAINKAKKKHRISVWESHATEEDKPVLELTGTNPNAFSVLAKAQRVARKEGMDFEEIRQEAIKSDYDHLLQTMMKYYEVQ